MENRIEILSKFCKEKAIIYPSSEIYGGLGGFYDYGHVGKLIKTNFENMWKFYFLNLNDNFYEVEGRNIMHNDVFKASGHLKNFTDPIIECKKGHVERADKLIESLLKIDAEAMSIEQINKLIKEKNLKCPSCGSDFNEAHSKNLMFPIDIGVGDANKAYLRPETAQTPFVNFKREFESLRKKLPLGLAVIGRAYRNEISPRHFVLRQREFTQAELQIFFNPNLVNEHDNFSDIADYELRVFSSNKRQELAQMIKAKDMNLPKFYTYHMAKVQQFYLNLLKIPRDKFRFKELNEEEKAFYNKYHFDVEIYLDDYGWLEIAGIHYRTDHDLHGHQEISKIKMEITDENGQKYIPHVLELSFGVDRNVFSLLHFAYIDNQERGNIVLNLPFNIAPFKVAVFPLVNKLDEKSKELYNTIRKQLISDINFRLYYDRSGSIGRRYARADELGVRYCITVDFETFDDNSVTIRNIETTEQKRIKISDIVTFITK